MLQGCRAVGQVCDLPYLCLALILRAGHRPALQVIVLPYKVTDLSCNWLPLLDLKRLGQSNVLQLGLDKVADDIINACICRYSQIFACANLAGYCESPVFPGLSDDASNLVRRHLALRSEERRVGKECRL